MSTVVSPGCMLTSSAQPVRIWHVLSTLYSARFNDTSSSPLGGLGGYVTGSSARAHALTHAHAPEVVYPGQGGRYSRYELVIQ